MWGCVHGDKHIFDPPPQKNLEMTLINIVITYIKKNSLFNYPILKIYNILCIIDKGQLVKLIMVKKRKSVLRSSAQVIDSPMKEPRIISNNNNYI